MQYCLVTLQDDCGILETVVLRNSQQMCLLIYQSLSSLSAINRIVLLAGRTLCHGIIVNYSTTLVTSSIGTLLLFGLSFRVFSD